MDYVATVSVHGALPGSWPMTWALHSVRSRWPLERKFHILGKSISLSCNGEPKENVGFEVILPCLFAYEIRFSLMSSMYDLLKVAESSTVTMTTSGAPATSSGRPVDREKRKNIVPINRVPNTIYFKRLLRNNIREDRDV
jgi:hypothetical protein